MGAEYNETILDARTPEDARSEFAAVIEGAAWENGHGGYTGTFAECPGLTITKQVFDAKDAGTAWLEQNAQKWEDALAVKIRLPGQNWYYLVGAWCSC